MNNVIENNYELIEKLYINANKDIVLDNRDLEICKQIIDQTESCTFEYILDGETIIKYDDIRCIDITKESHYIILKIAYYICQYLYKFGISLRNRNIRISKSSMFNFE